MNIQEIEAAIDKLSMKDREFLYDFASPGILRKLLSKDEIKKANQMVKLGLLIKGTSPDKPHGVVFYVDSSVHSRLY